jgi:glutaredoxin 3
MSAAPAIIMYVTGWCPYCSAARSLLRGKSAPFTEIDVDVDAGRRTEMVARSGRRTVPQIFIDGQHIGGYDDLAALDRAGRLDPLLAGSPAAPDRISRSSPS